MRFEYKQSVQIEAEGYQFYALIMAAMRQADSDNLKKLQDAFPKVWEELQHWYHTPGALED